MMFFSHKDLSCILVSLPLADIKDGFLVDSVFQGLLGILWILPFVYLIILFNQKHSKQFLDNSYKCTYE